MKVNPNSLTIEELRIIAQMTEDNNFRPDIAKRINRSIACVRRAQMKLFE